MGPSFQEEHFDAIAQGMQILEAEQQTATVIAALESELEEDMRNILNELAEDEWMHTPQQYF